MATVYGRQDVPSTYRDSRNSASLAEQHAQLNASKTLYVGNLSFYTSEEQIHELFRTVGPVRRIIMGLDRHNKTPCGFCFVEYYTHQAALDSLKFISGTKLDERIIRADLDPGYADGRQYGRGRSGGQVRDEFRDDYDVGRGGWGHLRARHEAAEALYREDHAYGGPRDVAVGETEYSRGDFTKAELDEEEENPRFRRERSEEE